MTNLIKENKELKDSVDNTKHYVMNFNGTTINMNIKGRININTKIIDEKTIDIDMEVEGQVIENIIGEVNAYGYYDQRNYGTYNYYVEKVESPITKIKNVTESPSVNRNLYNINDYDKEYKRNSETYRKFYRANAL